MEKKISFSAAVKTGGPPIPPPLSKPSQWENYLLQELKKVQTELTLMKSAMAEKDEQIKQLQTQLQVRAQQDETSKHESNEAGADSTPMSTQATRILVSKVMSEMQEKEDMESNKKVIRIGGMQDDWTKAEVEEDEYMTDTAIWKLKLDKAVPFVDLGDPCYISIKGKQAVVHYENMTEKIAVMKQTKSLQGTKVWISDELTPLQLKNRATELVKVREARKEGKWAVYRGGKAIIKEFKNPLPSG